MIRSGLAAVVMAACAVAGGCQAPMLSADDTVIIGDRKSPIHVCAMPHVLIGIGDQVTDSAAYGQAGLLPRTTLRRMPEK